MAQTLTGGLKIIEDTDAADQTIENQNTQILDRSLVDTSRYSTYKTGLDANGLYTTVDFKRSDGTLILKSVLSGGTTPLYTTRTETKYAANGVTVEWTKVYTITYDVNGNVSSEVMA